MEEAIRPLGITDVVVRVAHQALLVVVTGAMSRIVERWFPEPEPSPTAAEALRRLRASQAAAAAGAPTEAELVAVISAAVHRPRARRQ